MARRAWQLAARRSLRLEDLAGGRVGEKPRRRTLTGCRTRTAVTALPVTRPAAVRARPDRRPRRQLFWSGLLPLSPALRHDGGRRPLRPARPRRPPLPDRRRRAR